MNIFFRIFIIILVFSFISTIPQIWHLVMQSIGVEQIHFDHLPSFYGAPSLDDGISEENRLALGQEFHYLDKGCQVIVFESADKNYVLKFMRASKYKIPFWMNQLSFLPSIEKGRKKRLRNLEEKYLHELQSYQISLEHLKPETGILYAHLNKTSHFKKKLCIVGRLGRKKEIDLDTTVFLLQKKAKILTSVFTEINIHQDLQRAKEIACSYFSTISSVYSKGIIPNFHALFNLGVLDEKVIFTDLGSFYYSKNQAASSFSREEFQELIRRYHRILVFHFPRLESAFDEALEYELSCLEKKEA